MVQIYKKSLVLARLKGGAGDIVNLVSNDCQKVCEFKEAHRRGVYSAIFDNDDQVLTGGGDDFNKIWRSNKYIK